MNGTKDVWQSKTIWGGFIMGVAYLLHFMWGIDISSEEQVKLTEAWITAVSTVGNLIGYVMVFYGRIVADKKVVVKKRKAA